MVLIEPERFELMVSTALGGLPSKLGRAICAICSTDDEVVVQIRRTVIHEVGQHFGISDGRLHELGW